MYRATLRKSDREAHSVARNIDDGDLDGPSDADGFPHALFDLFVWATVFKRRQVFWGKHLRAQFIMQVFHSYSEIQKNLGRDAILLTNDPQQQVLRRDQIVSQSA